jgi:hypothetical protein
MTCIICRVVENVIASLVEPLPVKMQWLYPMFKLEGKGETQVLTGKTFQTIMPM